MDRLEEIKRDIREKLANGSPFVSLTIGDAVDLLSCIEAAEAALFKIDTLCQADKDAGLDDPFVAEVLQIVREVCPLPSHEDVLGILKPDKLKGGDA